MDATGTDWSSSSPTDEPAEQTTPPRKHRSFLAELPVLIIIAFVLALVLKTFLVQAFYIPSASMEPTLLVGDRVLVNKVLYKIRDPRRGEVVVFSTQEEGEAPPQGNLITRLLSGLSSGLGVAPAGEKDFIKRVIGLPGETVEMRGGVVYINGNPLPEETTAEGGYLADRDLNDFGPVTVPDGQYFMMGDNRLNSSDSRFSLGTIPRDQIVGRAFVVIWPVKQLGTLPRGEYGEALSLAPALAAVA